MAYVGVTGAAMAVTELTNAPLLLAIAPPAALNPPACLTPVLLVIMPLPLAPLQHSAVLPLPLHHAWCALPPYIVLRPAEQKWGLMGSYVPFSSER